MFVSIKDNGVGIPDDLLPHVFDLFRQAESALDRAQGGLGIGLTVVKSLIEMHLGRVAMHGNGAEAGTTVTINLPLLATSEFAGHRLDPISSMVNVTKPVRVLIVDDHVDGALALERLLTRRGCAVRVAHDGPSGASAAQEFVPEVLLLDLGLPGYDGYELARLLRADPRLSRAHFIAVSGYAQEGDRARCLAGGFNEHCPKPIDFNSLIASIQALT